MPTSLAIGRWMMEGSYPSEQPPNRHSTVQSAAGALRRGDLGHTKRSFTRRIVASATRRREGRKKNVERETSQGYSDESSMPCCAA
jgi:hypothetical protein